MRVASRYLSCDLDSTMPRQYPFVGMDFTKWHNLSFLHERNLRFSTSARIHTIHTVSEGHRRDHVRVLLAVQLVELLQQSLL
jgi:hypothetical protein